MSTIPEREFACAKPTESSRSSPAPAVLALSLVVASLALVAAAAGLFWPGGTGEHTFTPLRGEQVDIFGEGLYRYDTVFRAAGNRGGDVATLIFGIPALLVSTLLYRRGSLKGCLLLTGVLLYFLYVYASLSTNTAFNELFLVYIATFSASFFAFVILFQQVWRQPGLFSAPLPRRGISAFLFACAALPAYVWLEPIIRSLASGEPPALLDHNTTMVTEALDLGLIVPTLIIAGSMLVGRNLRGYLLAWPMLVLLVFVAISITVQTVFQLSAGIEFTPPEIIGPISGFLVVGAIAVYVIVRMLRGVPAEPDHG